MCLNAIRARHRADEPSLQEGTPLVHQTAVSSIIILQRKWGHVSHEDSLLDTTRILAVKFDLMDTLTVCMCEIKPLFYISICPSLRAISVGLH